MPEANLSRHHRGAQQRARAEPAPEVRQRLRLALLEVEDRAGVVPQAREAERDEPVSDGERREPLADRDLERAGRAGAPGEEPLDRVRLVLASVDERAQLRGRARLEQRPDRGGLLGEAEPAGSFEHGGLGSHTRIISRCTDTIRAFGRGGAVAFRMSSGTRRTARRSWP